MTEQEKKYKKSLSYAAKYCSTSEKCKFDVIKKLKLKELCSDDINKILDYLETENYIDERRYAKFYTNDAFKFNKWGKIKIRAFLSAKNISDKFIFEALYEIDNKEYYEMLKNLLVKKNLALFDEDLFLKKAKLIKYAASKGFENELILKVMDDVL